MTRTLALSYLQRGQLPEAEREFKKLIALSPDDALGHANLGLTYIQGGRLSEAEPELLRARELEPENPDVGLLIARLYSLTGRSDEARATLERFRRDTTTSARILYALATLDAQSSDSVSLRRYEELLRQVLEVSPANVAVRLELVRALVRREQGDSALAQLEEVRRIPPAPPVEARPSLDSTFRLFQAGNLAEGRAALDHFVGLLEVTAPYQASLDDVKWADGPLVGRPMLTFAPTNIIALRGVREKATVDSVRFVDVTDDAGLVDPASRAAPPSGSPSVPPGSTALAAADVNGDGADDLFVSRATSRLYFVQRGFASDMSERVGIPLPRNATFATFADVDNDGWLDLFAIGAGGAGILLRNRGNGTFEDVTARAGVGQVRGARKAVFVDVDHDGDLDLLLVRGAPLVVFRNNLDGTFTEASASFGLAGNTAVSDAAFADFDGDGRIDVVLTDEQGGDVVLENTGPDRLRDATAASGISSRGSGAIAVGDFDNDGSLDLLSASASGGAAALWRNQGTGVFTLDRRSDRALQQLASITAIAAEFLDYDNDGWLDLAVSGAPRVRGGPGLFLYRNQGNGTFTDRSLLLPAGIRRGSVSALTVNDLDQDGDEDFLVTDSVGAVRFLRNDGGNSNMAMRVELKGLRTGSGKNNDFGIGARLEVRAQEIYQTRVVTRRVTHFGLGRHLKADVLRVEWTNGVPQTVYLPGTDADVVESELLKGSCAFLYAWDGTGFRFVTDVMWRSALGMPLGLMGLSGRFAPAGASQEYLRIPGSALEPRDGRYVLQLTEELWETAYVDEIKLVAVDHPDSVDVFVDERFIPPGPVKLKVFRVPRPRPPVRATDHRGRDVLPALRDLDAVYVSNLTPLQYQGVVEPHELILDLGEGAGRAGSVLLLRGWIYPTDASINVALGQQTRVKLSAPSLEVHDGRRWITAIPDIGFPSGKDKTLAIDLAGKFPTADHRVRIRTNMQIYWDQALVGSDAASDLTTVTTLEPVSADLHFRGFSRMYRKGGRHGPHWFAYDEVSRETPWRNIEGSFTRFGDILPLFEQADDMYAVMGPGDEATITFDATAAPALRPGWKRDFLLYTDGWIKDSDLNTAHGTTVEPLPFHAIKSYPYAVGESYPSDAAHTRYLREYNTRRAR